MISQNIVRKGYSAFNAPGWVTDHRAIFFDIDTAALFSSEINILPQFESRTLQANNLKQVMNYLKHLDKHLPIDILLQQCHNLYNTTAEWTDVCANEFETIDTTLTSAMIQAEKSLKKQHNLPWSPELDEAYAIYTYWRKKISANRNRMKVQDQLTDIIQKYGEKIYQGFKRRHPYQKLRRATRKYHKCQSNSAALRETHLQLRYEILIDS